MPCLYICGRIIDGCELPYCGGDECQKYPKLDNPEKYQ